MTNSTRRALLVCAAVFLIIHAVLAVQLFAGRDDWIFYGTPLEAIVYAVAAFVLLRDDGTDPGAGRSGLWLILGMAAVIRLMLLFAAPVSTDIYRYIWDGLVQGAGINPYRYIPADPALAFLRDQDIYPLINRASYAPTIYPPLAQIVFFLVTRIGRDVWLMKAAMVGFELIAGWAIMRLLAARGLPANRILLYAWHPLPLWEFSGSGHVDAIALACVMLGLLAAETGRPALAGVMLSGAALVKFFPVVIGPAAYRRWDWRLPAAGLAMLVVLYLPYIGVGPKVFGFLSGYSAEEGLQDGSGVYLWELIRHVIPTLQPGLFTLYIPVAALILLAMGIAVLMRRSSHVSFVGALALAATFTILVSPHYPWYLAWLVPFLCFVPSWGIIYLTGSSSFLYLAGLPPSFFWYSLIYVPTFVLLALQALASFRAGRRPVAQAVA